MSKENNKSSVSRYNIEWCSAMSLYFVITIDVDPPFSASQNQMIESGTLHLLNLLEECNVKATFFVPAVVSKTFPELIEEIVKRRHEIGCHGLKHDPLETTLNVNKQIKMVRMATDIIESTIGVRPRGFRAPLFRCNRDFWVALQKNCYVYDSSYVCSPFYGNGRVPFWKKPFYIKTSEKNNGLLEIPISVNPFLPFPLGGAWFRIFGLRWAKIGVKINFIFQTPVVFYIHPKDVIFDTHGFSWYYYRNTVKSLRMLREVIEYVKKNGAKFLKAYELADLYSRKRQVE